MSRPQPDGLGTAISALYYEDGMRKPLTKRTLELIEETKANGGKAISFFLDGLVHFPTDEESAESLHRAAESGLDHPFLSYVLGECYRYGDKGVPKNIDRAIEWYKKAISVGSTWGYFGLHNIYLSERGGRVAAAGKALAFLKDIEMQGISGDGLILCLIGNYLHTPSGLHFKKDRLRSIEYLQRASLLGYAPSYIHMFHLLWVGGGGVLEDREQAVMTLLEAEKKGIGAKDDRILGAVLDTLYNDAYRPGNQVLGKFKSKTDMALYYSKVLIRRESPLGYLKKGFVLMSKWVDDHAGAILLFEEADKLGLATLEAYWNSYIGLIDAYIRGSVVPQDGAKALEFCYRALDVANTKSEKAAIYRCMVDIYECATSQIAADDQKARHFLNLAESLDPLGDN